MEALFALVGVVVGGLLTYFLTFRIEQARWKREDKYRWTQEKRAAYAKFISAATDAHSLLSSLAVMKGSEEASHQELRKKTYRRLEEIGNAMGEINLLGHQELVSAANDVLKPVANITMKGFGGITLQESEKYLQQMQEARKKFVELARKDLAGELKAD